jgi:dTDP-4-dehydrorhamnose 3,5-epimerase-like enzyme
MPKPSKEWNLQKINPAVAKQWHPSKKGSLKPIHVAPNTKKKVWWVCDRGHEWYARVDLRNRGRGYPFCSLLKADLDNCLKTVNPQVASELKQ